MTKEPLAGTRQVTRGTFIKETVAASAALGVAGTVASTARAAGRVEAPYVKTSPSGEVLVWSSILFPDSQIAAFNKVYPNVKVTQVKKTYLVNVPNGFAPLLTGVGAPDGVFFLEDAYLGKYADILYDVSSAIEPFAAKIAPYKLAVAKQGGKTVSIPEDVDPAFLIYNRDIVARAGVDVSKIRTYDDLIAASLTVKAKVPSCTTPLFFASDTPLLVFMLEGLAWQQHSGMGDAAGKLQLDAQAYTNAFTYLEKAAKAGVVSTALFNTPSLFNLWNKGQACFTHYANWWTYYNATGMKPLWGKIGLAKQPVFSSGDSPYSMMGGSGFIVPARGKRPDLGALFGAFMFLDPRGFGAAKDFSNYQTVLPAVQGLWDIVKPIQGPRQLYPLLSPAVDQHALMVAAAEGAPTSYRYPPWYSNTFPYLAPKIASVLSGQLGAKAAQQQAYQDVLSKVVQRYR